MRFLRKHSQQQSALAAAHRECNTTVIDRHEPRNARVSDTAGACATIARIHSAVLEGCRPGASAKGTKQMRSHHLRQVQHRSFGDCYITEWQQHRADVGTGPTPGGHPSNRVR